MIAHDGIGVFVIHTLKKLDLAGMVEIVRSYPGHQRYNQRRSAIGRFGQIPC